jgi:hypothetical protein
MLSKSDAHAARQNSKTSSWGTPASISASVTLDKILKASRASLALNSGDEIGVMIAADA